MRSFIIVTLNTLNVFGMFAMLGARIWVAKTFWRSSAEQTSDTELTLLHFNEKSEAFTLSPEAISSISLAIDMACPLMLALGFGTRISAAIMLIIIGIQLSMDINTALYVWAALLSIILTYGPNKLSLDFVLARIILKPKKE